MKPEYTTLRVYDLFEVCSYIQEKYKRFIYYVPEPKYGLKGERMVDRILSYLECGNDSYHSLPTLEFSFYDKELQLDIETLYKEYPEEKEKGMFVIVSW